MSYSNPNLYIPYDGNGVRTRFDINFFYLEGESPESIKAELWDFTDTANPIKQAFSNPLDYTVDETNYPTSEVVTSVPVPNDFKIIVFRATEPESQASFIQGAFPSESITEALDRVVQISQENKEALTRTLTLTIADTLATPPVALPDVGTLLESIATNASGIATNVLDIATNTADIAAINIDSAQITTNQSNIATNTADIATNTADIATNVSDIAANTAAISALSGETLVPRTVTGAYAASAGDIVLLQTTGITVNLPAPVLNAQVKVKMDGIQAGSTIATGASIDGFGASYTLSSDYESVSLVSDGSKWYII